MEIRLWKNFDKRFSHNDRQMDRCKDGQNVYINLLLQSFAARCLLKMHNQTDKLDV